MRINKRKYLTEATVKEAATVLAKVVSQNRDEKDRVSAKYKDDLLDCFDGVISEKGLTSSDDTQVKALMKKHGLDEKEALLCTLMQSFSNKLVDKGTIKNKDGSDLKVADAAKLLLDGGENSVLSGFAEVLDVSDNVSKLLKVCKELSVSSATNTVKSKMKESHRNTRRRLSESHSVKDFEIFENCKKYLPKFGEGDSRGTQAATAINKLVYRWFNDGDVFDNTYGMEGWANDISGSANWLYKYVEDAAVILNRIEKTYGADQYTDLLFDLCAVVDPQIPELLDMPKIGNAYDEKGVFFFRDHSDEDDEDDYDYDYGYDEDDEL